jgi:hypothetical protein
MLILDTTDKSLMVRLAAVHTTSPLRCVASWRETAITEFTPGNTLSNTNGTTAVDLASAPASGKQKIIDYVSILNTDTITHTVTVSVYNGSMHFDIVSISIGPGERIEYTDQGGFNCYNAAGSLKTLVVATQNVVGSGFSAVVLGSDVVNNNGVANTIADVTGLSFPVVAGTQYFFQFFIRYTSAAGTTGSRWSINGPASPTFLTYRSDYALTATTRTANEAVAYDMPAASNATSPQSALGNIASIEGFIQPSAGGSVIARFASEIASSAITAKAGSLVRYIATI